MPVRARIEYVGDPVAQKRRFKRIVRDGLKATVRFWHEQFEARHFTRKGAQLYGYQPRAGDDEGPVDARGRPNWRYSWRKRKVKGHNRPLVWSGQSELRARGQLQISGNSKVARGRFRMPKHFYQYRPNLNQPDKAAELLAVIQPEVMRMAHFQQKLVTRGLRAVRDRRTRRV